MIAPILPSTMGYLFTEGFFIDLNYTIGNDVICIMLD